MAKSSKTKTNVGASKMPMSFAPVADTVHGTPKYTARSDMQADLRAGIKPGSKRDQALDKKRGLKS